MHLYLNISVGLLFCCSWLLVVIVVFGTPIRRKTTLQTTFLAVLPANLPIHHIHVAIVNNWIVHLRGTIRALLVLAVHLVAR
jgi:hypothetical protein